MTMNIHQNDTPLRDILYEFSLSLDEHELNSDLLDDFIRRFPSYSQELTDFAIELAAYALRPEPPTDAVDAAANPERRSPAVARAMSNFQNRLYALKRSESVATTHKVSQVESAVNPFATLDQKAIRAFAEQLPSNTTFVIKLRDRLIDPVTLSVGFIRRVSELLNISVDVVNDHFRAPTQLQVCAQFYKSEQKPLVGNRQSFEDAVRNSGLSEDQQRYLLSL
jgi:hypothetical protein